MITIQPIWFGEPSEEKELRLEDFPAYVNHLLELGYEVQVTAVEVDEEESNPLSSPASAWQAGENFRKELENVEDVDEFPRLVIKAANAKYEAKSYLWWQFVKGAMHCEFTT